MPTLCPNCSRSLDVSTLTGDVPLYCMYCGAKLRQVLNDETLTHVPQPGSSNRLNHLLGGLESVSAQGDFAITRSLVNVEQDEPAVQESAPSQVSGYRLVRFIGGGGMGNVYEGLSIETGERVAVKLLSRRLSFNSSSTERFRQEGRLASQITHPRCVFVIRADTDHGRPFIVMELMPGETLKDLVDRRGPLPLGEAVAHMLDVIEGLIEAHRLGVIHRDVKPSNCFLTSEGRVKVGDFGLSKSLSGNEPDKQLTSTGTFLGTILFAAPEQIRHEPVGYDSDVYAVCATLYYLLVGQAPHQHESLTAVLAKAISEDPPPLRPKRPDVSVQLEKIILKGLDRDRARRYARLEDLQTALLDQQPASQVPAGLRSLCLAYIVDFLILQVVFGAFELFRQLAFNWSPDVNRVLDTVWPGYLITFSYFTLCEGLFATTPGKLLFRLRVRRIGETGVPGLHWATLRTLVYNAIWALAPFAIALDLNWFVMFLTWIITAALLLFQIRRTALGHRGLHDLVAGTRVIQKPLPARQSRLVSRYVAPLDKVITAKRPLVPQVGTFSVQGKLCDVEDGGELWIGEDASLGRRVLIRIAPPGQSDDSLHVEPVVRPTRLRAVGHGMIDWGEGERAWVAHVAPMGAPLSDIVSKENPLAWADASGILDQLLAELREGQKEANNPEVLTTDQIWVERNGRVQLLDFPVPNGQALAKGECKSRYPSGTDDPMKFLRQTVTLMLEGSPRNTSKPLQAPLPSKSAWVLNGLMENQYESLEELHTEVKALRQNPLEVTTSIRIGQISVQSLLMAFGLITMFSLSGLFNFFLAFGLTQSASRFSGVQEAIATSQQRDQWLRFASENASTLKERDRRDRLEKAFSAEHFEETNSQVIESAQAELHVRQQLELRLNRVERAIIQQVQLQNQKPLDPDNPKSLVVLDQAIDPSRARVHMIVNGRKTTEPDQFLHELDAQRSQIALTLFFIFAAWPVVIWPVFSLVFRGGLAHVIAGVTLVRRSGRPAARWRCALRTFLVWLPLLVVLSLCHFVQMLSPASVTVRTALWLLGIMLLPMMFLIALRDPVRGPHDRLLGTYLVPG